LFCCLLFVASSSAISKTITIQKTVPAPVAVPVQEPEPCPAVVEQPAVVSDGKTESIVAGGTKIAKVITAKLVSPFVIGASKVAGAAGALPPLLAAKGAFLGKVIAVPIQVGASAASGLISGVTGFLVGIPVGIGTGVVAAAHGVQQNMGHIKSYASRAGQFMMKPIAIIVAGKTHLLGAKAKFIGTKMQGLGQMLTAGGAKLSAEGDVLKSGLGGHKYGGMQNIEVLPVDTSLGADHVTKLLEMIPSHVLVAINKAIETVANHGRGATGAVIPLPFLSNKFSSAPVAGVSSCCGSGASVVVLPVPTPTPAGPSTSTSNLLNDF